MEFCVWAPTARTVEIELAGACHAMLRDETAWWSVDLPDVGPGSDYTYRVDDKGGLPDPRSPWQPRGPHGPSRTVDHRRYPWTDQRWQALPLAAAVIYELHVGTFTAQGTFTAIVARLDHLRDLGVTHVELMPIAEFAGTRGWGYDGVNLFAPFHHYGTPDDLKTLVNACHAAGLGVLLDVVYNHLGPTGNYLPLFGPYFTDRHHTAWGSAVNFDGPGSSEVRRFFCDNALMWLQDYHFDGLRLDAVDAILDTSAIPFLEQLAIEVEGLEGHVGRHFTVIAESDLNDPRLLRAREAGGFALDAQWNDDFHHALHAVLTGEQVGYYQDFGSLAQLATALQQPYVYDGCPSRFRQRCHGRPAESLSGHRFVVSLQNHDQIGNRARGDRIGQLVNEQRAKIGAAVLLLAPGVPLLFQGEEWNAGTPFQYFVDFQDEPELARAVTEGRRHEFERSGWKPEEVPDPQAAETFQRCKLRWQELDDARHASMLQWYKQLLRLRRQFSELTDGRRELVQTKYSEAESWLVVERGRVTIVCNLAEYPQTIALSPDQPARLHLASRAALEVVDGSLALPGETVAVLGPDRDESCKSW